MTTLGKILAIMNLVLSVLVGAFIVMTYVTQTNWHQAFNEAVKQAEVARTDAESSRRRMEEVQGEKAKVDRQLADASSGSKKEVGEKNKEIEGLNLKLNEKKVEIDKHVAAQAALTAENERRQKETDYLKGLVTARDLAIKKMEKSVEDMRASMVDELLARKASDERNNRLLEENERLASAVRKLEQATGTGVAGRSGPQKNPPAHDVEGLVQKADAETGYVTLTIGSDAGLNKGNTLEVYRLKPDPTYLGTVEVLAVRPNEAVAKPLSRTRGAIQVGDQVSSSIAHRR